MLHSNRNGNTETKRFENRKQFFFKIKERKRFGNLDIYIYIYIYFKQQKSKT